MAANSRPSVLHCRETCTTLDTAVGDAVSECTSRRAGQLEQPSVFGGVRVLEPGKENKFELRRQQVLAGRNRPCCPGVVPAAAQHDSSGHGQAEAALAAALASKPGQNQAGSARASFSASHISPASGEAPQTSSTPFLAHADEQELDSVQAQSAWVQEQLDWWTATVPPRLDAQPLMPMGI